MAPGAAPDDCLVLVLAKKRVHGKNFEAVLPHGRHNLALFVDHELGAANAEQVGDARPVQIDIKDADPVAELDQGTGHVDRNRALAHTALAAHDEELVLDMGKAILDLPVLSGHHVAGTGALGAS